MTDKEKFDAIAEFIKKNGSHSEFFQDYDLILSDHINLYYEENSNFLNGYTSYDAKQDIKPENIDRLIDFLKDKIKMVVELNNLLESLEE